MGEPKQLLPIGGIPMVRRATVAALASLCRPVVVVVGANADAVTAALEGLPVSIAINPAWASGMGTSIQAGIRSLPESVDGAVLALADQPLITSDIYDDLVRLASEAGRPIVASRYAGTVGVPVLFSRAYFPNLLALAPSQGCKGVIQANLANALLVDCPDAEVDVDTRESYEQLAQVAASP